MDSKQIKRQARGVMVSEDSQDECLGVIQSETDSLSSTDAPWTANLELNGKNIEFKIDTGADVTTGWTISTNNLFLGPQKLGSLWETSQISS